MTDITTVAATVLTPSETHLQYLVRNTEACVLKPFSFFVSWQGVLTLAYRGFPPALVRLKQSINDCFDALPKENPGSKWPKTSLGAIKDGKRLTPEQLQRLNELCRTASGIFQVPCAPKSQSVMVDKLAVVVYECRSLERKLLLNEVPLTQPADTSEASAEEAARVDGILSEADDPDYWFHASRDGSRHSHYKGNALGVTLIHELEPLKQAASSQQPSTGGSWGSALPGIIRGFRERVDAELPGMYTWFDDSSLHVTVRAIIA